MDSLESPTCAGCGKTPGQIREYTAVALDFQLSNDEFVRAFEPTWSRPHNLYLCPDCQITGRVRAEPILNDDQIDHLTERFTRGG